MKTLIVNLFAGPGAGKSTKAAGLFYNLKTAGYNVELVTEFAKDLTWEQRHQTLSDQVYILGKQQHRFHRLRGQVEAIITDSPILISLLYAPKGVAYCQAFQDLVLALHCEYASINVFVDRVKEYNPKGRNQTESEAQQLDLDMQQLLSTHRIHYEKYVGNPEGLQQLTNHVVGALELRRLPYPEREK